MLPYGISEAVAGVVLLVLLLVQDALGVIVVAPVAEELFFRASSYRALRTRLRVWPAQPVDGLVFGALHLQGTDTAIAIHAAFNAVAMLPVVPVPAVLIGAAVLVACLVAPRKAGRWPSPVPA